MNRRLLIVIAVVAVLGSLFLFGLLRGSPDRIITSNMIGQSVPSFRLPVHTNLTPQYGPEFEYASASFGRPVIINRSEEHTSELQSRGHLVCRLLLEKKNHA